MRPVLTEIANRHGTPFYAHFLEDIDERLRLLTETLGLEISYAVKANPHPTVLDHLRGRVAGLDVSSAGEIVAAREGGWSGESLTFTGPGKTDDELRFALGEGVTVVLESVEEAGRLADLAGDARCPVLVRVSPSQLPKGFGVRMAGRPTQFGIDEEELDPALDEIRHRSGLALVGLHAFAGTQCLDADSVAENWLRLAEIFERAAVTHDLDPEVFLFGAGLGIPYHEGDEEVLLPRVAARAGPAFRALRERFHGVRLLLETGRYVVGPAGVYVTRVTRVKRSRGRLIGICDGGMHHHLAACGHLGSVIHRNYPIEKIPAGEGEAEECDLVGPLCTSIDTLAHGVGLRDLREGDLIVVRQSGAYGATASPGRFISHPAPEEYHVRSDGRYEP